MNVFTVVFLKAGSKRRYLLLTSNMYLFNFIVKTALFFKKHLLKLSFQDLLRPILTHRIGTAILNQNRKRERTGFGVQTSALSIS